MGIITDEMIEESRKLEVKVVDKTLPPV